MHCPVCKDPKLVISERQGIEIDYCPDCRGVWLDRGELDKLIEKSVADMAPPPAAAAPVREAQYDRRDDRRDNRYDERKYDKHGGQRKKPTSWLSEFFD